MPRIVDKEARRAEIVAVAARVFGERGVSRTAVSDIVKAAGIAQGTFYLYFDSKEDVVLAVVGQMADELAAAIEEAVEKPDESAVEKLLTLRDVLGGFEGDTSAVAMADFIHCPENHSLHDRLTEHLAERLATVVEGIVAQGVAEGAFSVPDVSSAAWFVLGGLQSVELRGVPTSDVPAAIGQATVYALRALGYAEEIA